MAIKLTNPPLTPDVLHVLLALSAAEQHGYGIMKQVAGAKKSFRSESFKKRTAVVSNKTL